jgi:hypothetical protein
MVLCWAWKFENVLIIIWRILRFIGEVDNKSVFHFFYNVCLKRVSLPQHLAIHYATSRKVAGSIPDEVSGFFNWHNPFSRTRALWSIHPLTETSTRNLPMGNGWLAVRPSPSVSRLSRKMWDTRRLANLWASMACYRDSFTFISFLHAQMHVGLLEESSLNMSDVTVHWNGLTISCHVSLYAIPRKSVLWFSSCFLWYRRMHWGKLTDPLLGCDRSHRFRIPPALCIYGFRMILGINSNWFHKLH